uniref:Uncharacterized protein n=1 Tax=Hyaloperonospora arabidopsidis (strain Emoy2) TaxID=559515 RepID=M4BFM8_HYAAE
MTASITDKNPLPEWRVLPAAKNLGARQSSSRFGVNGALLFRSGIWFLFCTIKAEDYTLDCSMKWRCFPARTLGIEDTRSDNRRCKRDGP